MVRATSKYIERIKRHRERIKLRRLCADLYDGPWRGKTRKEHYEDCMKELPHSESS